MQNTPSDLEIQLINALTKDQPLRLWSFVVSIFGELAPGPHDQISGALLNALVSRIGAKPEALRVALHRLKKDGWISSRKYGRQSKYSLTQPARAETLKAYPTIYPYSQGEGGVEGKGEGIGKGGGNGTSEGEVERNGKGEGEVERNGTSEGKVECNGTSEGEAWMVVSEGAHGKLEPSPHRISVAPNLWVASQRPADPSLWAVPITPSSAVPAWIKTKVCDGAAMAQCDTLCQILTQNDPQSGLDKDDRAILRLLIVHNWRRIVLKQPKVPSFLFPDRWRGDQCRARVHQHLDALTPVPLAELMDTAG